MKIKLDPGAYMPTIAYEGDGGFDLYARETQIVPAKESAIFDTGVHIELPYFSYDIGLWCGRSKTVGLLKSKSGLNVKHGLTSEGVIDMGYRGSIVVKLFNHSGYDYKVNKGDKISQLIIVPVVSLLSKAPDKAVVDEMFSSYDTTVTVPVKKNLGGHK